MYRTCYQRSNNSARQSESGRGIHTDETNFSRVRIIFVLVCQVRSLSKDVSCVSYVGHSEHRSLPWIQSCTKRLHPKDSIRTNLRIGTCLGHMDDETGSFTKFRSFPSQGTPLTRVTTQSHSRTIWCVPGRNYVNRWPIGPAAP
jgi:hypothetical protein